MDAAQWAQTVSVATSEGVIQADPGSGAYTNTHSDAALASLRDDGLDVNGSGYSPRSVTLNPGGE